MYGSTHMKMYDISDAYIANNILHVQLHKCTLMQFLSTSFVHDSS